MTAIMEPTTGETCPSWCTADHTAADWQGVRERRRGIYHKAVELSVSTPVPPQMIESWRCEDEAVDVSLVMLYEPLGLGSTLPSIWLVGAGEANLSAAAAKGIGEALMAAADKLSQIEDAR